MMLMFRFVSFRSVYYTVLYSVLFRPLPFSFGEENDSIVRKQTHASEWFRTKQFEDVRSDLYRSSRSSLARIRSIRQVTKVYSSYKRQRILHYERMNFLAIVSAAKSSLNRYIHLPNRSGEVAQ